MAESTSPDLSIVTGRVVSFAEAQFANADHARRTARGFFVGFLPKNRKMAESLPIDDLLSQLMFRGDDRLIQASYVRGRCVYSADE